MRAGGWDEYTKPYYAQIKFEYIYADGSSHIIHEGYEQEWSSEKTLLWMDEGDKIKMTFSTTGGNWAGCVLNGTRIYID